MIKSISLLGAALFFSTSSYSQEVTIKPSLGLNFSHFSKTSDVNTYKAKLGYEIGASVALGQKLYVEPGIFYVKKSTGYTYNDSASVHNTRFTMHGIRVPLAIGYNIIGGEDQSELMRLRVFAGGSALLLRRKDLAAGTNRVQWGVFGGVGFDLAFLFLEAQYEWSLTSIQKDVSMVDIGKSRSVIIKGGFRIPIGR